MDELTDEQIRKLVILFSNLRREYERFRMDAHIMESGTQFQARMVEFDLVKRGYKIERSIEEPFP